MATDTTGARGEAALLEEIAAVYGPTKIELGLRLAVEAGKLGLVETDLYPMARTVMALRALGIDMEPNESAFQWGRRVGLIPDQSARDAEAADILGMRN